jgi:hypothetical protein
MRSECGDFTPCGYRTRVYVIPAQVKDSNQRSTPQPRLAPLREDFSHHLVRKANVIVDFIFGTVEEAYCTVLYYSGHFRHAIEPAGG